MSVLVGKQAPDFDVKAVVNGNEIKESFTLSQFKGKNYVLLFFYPLDFTFVCPTELHAFQEELVWFEQRGVQVLGCSVDSEHSHYAWLNTPKEKGGIKGVTYPLLSDMKKEIAQDYDVLEESGITYRGLFLMDKEGVVRHQLVNDLPLGRNIQEAKRIVEALQFHEKVGEVCPANWKEGQKSMTADRDGVEAYFEA